MEDFYVDYADLDDIQRTIIKRRLNKSMVITGTAGSGKTVLAVHKLRQVRAKGTYAIIVYTKSLKKYFLDGVKDMKKDYQENFDEYVPINENMIFYYQEWKTWYEKHPNYKVQYLIVDECQDFSREQIQEMNEFADLCFYFGDAEQTIMDFGDKETMPPQNIASMLGIVVDKLYKNYRLTIETAKVAERIPRPLLDTYVSDDCDRHGEKPRLISANSFDAQLIKIINIIRNRSLSNVGILLRYNTKRTASNHSDSEKRSVEYVKDFFQNKGITVEYKYNINRDTDMDLDFNSSNPKILTWWCAKGLQFQDVFIVDCDYDYWSDEDTRKSQKTVAAAWYVALTRTSERLYLSFTGDLCSHFPSTSSNLYANPL